MENCKQRACKILYLLLAEEGKLDDDSVFLDVGSGLGKPNFHVSHRVKYSVGVELEFVRLQLAYHNQRQILETVASAPTNVGVVVCRACVYVFRKLHLLLAFSLFL